jgi:hypothetical protein
LTPEICKQFWVNSRPIVFGVFSFTIGDKLDALHGYATYQWIQDRPYNGRIISGRDVLRVVDGRITLLFMVIDESSSSSRCLSRRDRRDPALPTTCMYSTTCCQPTKLRILGIAGAGAALGL